MGFDQFDAQITGQLRTDCTTAVPGMAMSISNHQEAIGCSIPSFPDNGRGSVLTRFDAAMVPCSSTGGVLAVDSHHQIKVGSSPCCLANGGGELRVAKVLVLDTTELDAHSM